MAKDFWISDLHFGHKSALEFDNRPFKTIEEMDNYMIANWNRVVSDEDTVRIVGDISYRSSLGPIWYLKRLFVKVAIDM